MQPSPEEAAQRARARGALLEFTRQTHHGYEANWHHAALCDRVQQWAHTPDARLIVTLPPRHGKSQIVSRALPAWLLGHWPDAEIILTSYGQSLASDMSLDVQRIMSSDTYADIFPGTRIARKGTGEAVRRADSFGVVGRRGVVRAAGAGGPITGKGGRFIIVDDPHKNRDEAESPVMRERVAKWFSADLSTRCEPGARILICQTRWHEEDLTGHVLAQQAADAKADRWDVLHLPALLDAEGKRSPDDPRAVGAALWPERYPVKRLEAIRARSEYDWWSLYQGDPRQGGYTEWPSTHFGDHLWFGEWPAHLTQRVVSVDASKGSADKPGDFTAIMAVGRCHQGHLWAEATLERLAPEAVVERTLDVVEAFGADAVAVEANVFQELFLVLMNRRARERGIVFPALPVVNCVNKEVRIRRLGPYLAGRKLHVRATPGGKLLVDQLRQFPLAAHDDGPDSLEMGIRVMIEQANGRKKR